MLQLQWDPGHLLKNWADRQMVGIPTWGKVWNVLVWGGEWGERECAAAAGGHLLEDRADRQMVGIPMSRGGGQCGMC